MIVHHSAGTPTLPKLVLAPDGSLHVFFLDSGFDSQHKLLDAVHSISRDAGATWTSERLTTKSWDPNLSIHQNGNPGWVGDYLGAAGSTDSVWAAFPDASLGEAPSLAVAHIVYN